MGKIKIVRTQAHNRDWLEIQEQSSVRVLGIETWDRLAVVPSEQAVVDFMLSHRARFLENSLESSRGEDSRE